MTAARAYAANTKVPIERTKQELERLVRAAGATGYASGWDPAQDRVEFLMNGKQIRFSLPRATSRNRELEERTNRQRWRALLLVVKAKLEAVRAGISVFEQEFLGYIVVPGQNRTVYDYATRALEAGEWRVDRLLPPARTED